MGAQKNVVTKYQIITAGTMTSTNTLTSTTIPVNYLDNVGIQVVWTGTPNGSFFVDASIDGTTWTSLTFDTAVAAVGAAGDAIFNLQEVPYPNLRLRYVNASGSGTLNAYFSAKEV